MHTNFIFYRLLNFLCEMWLLQMRKDYGKLKSNHILLNYEKQINSNTAKNPA